ncbi:hypothetical protein [Sphingomonas jatrophae]|uniref:Uncharacterized protein n=1 Tax=Sphingomonas jatrophae TaxID=1166337 RepID=A0A1I6K097_9SPHN|nr:hypothetical protein [Sphingomonas jatrophae]SFR84538.1 hypothetical protein SAMN05192580_1148 [Sphingomonas jatrophae]
MKTVLHDLALRLGGLALIAMAAGAFAALKHHCPSAGDWSDAAVCTLAWALAAACFLAASAGLALLALGRGILARVEVSARWRPVSAPPPAAR